MILGLFGLLLSAGLEQPVLADTCTWQPLTDYENDNYGTDEANYAAEVSFTQHMCAQGGNAQYGTRGLYYWNNLGFEKTYWDEGFGFENYCDARLPLARTLNAFDVLQNSYTPLATSWSDLSGPPVKWGWSYAARSYNDLDDLRAYCRNGDAYASSVSTLFDDYTALYMLFFNQLGTINRASTLFHESVHRTSGDSHTCNGNQDQYFFIDYKVFASCVAGSSPDCMCERIGCKKLVINPNPTHISVYAWHALWLLSYYYDANANTSPSYKRWAGYRAKAILEWKFCDLGSVPSIWRNFTVQ
jgi:hypothetical protein